MKRGKICILVCIIIATMAGCAKESYNNVMKSGDPDLMFTKAMEYYKLKKYSRTVAILEASMHMYNGTSRDDSAAYYLADAYFRMDDFETSTLLLDEFRQTFTLSPFLEDVEYKYAGSFYFMSGEPNRDQTATLQALIAFDEYIERYPGTEKTELMKKDVVELTQKLHDKAFMNAKVYYTTRNFKAAAVAFRSALNQFPNTSHREEMLYLTTKSSFLLAEDSIETMKRERYQNVLDAYYSFVAEYPDSKHVTDVDKMVKKTREYLARFSDLDDSVAGGATI